MTKIKKSRCMLVFCSFIIMVVMLFGGNTEGSGGKPIENGNNANNNGNTGIENIIYVDSPKFDNELREYNGKEQQFTISSSEYYTINGDKATEVGKYKAVITLKKNNYKWLELKYRPYTTLNVIWYIVEAEDEVIDDVESE